MIRTTLKDAWGRKLEYLRVSVTDRCNLRCVYCMPAEGVECIGHDEVLRYEEILAVVRAGADLGVRRVRVTGGEPLVRKGLVPFIAQLAAMPGIEEVALTTNGLLLNGLAGELARAGLTRINVSLDSLKQDTFARLTRGGRVAAVLAGLEAAAAAGLEPLKINCVVIRSLNDDEVFDFAALTVDRPWHVRFIEYMPIGESPELSWPEHFVPIDEVRQRLSQRWRLTPARQPVGNGPAVYVRLPGARGTVGFITPMSEHFCASCNRLRLTADGRLRSCLLAGGEVDVKALLRGGDGVGLQEAFRRAIRLKPLDHGLEGPGGCGDSMVRLGG